MEELRFKAAYKGPEIYQVYTHMHQETQWWRDMSPVDDKDDAACIIKCTAGRC